MRTTHHNSSGQKIESKQFYALHLRIALQLHRCISIALQLYTSVHCLHQVLRKMQDKQQLLDSRAMQDARMRRGLSCHHPIILFIGVFLNSLGMPCPVCLCVHVIYNMYAYTHQHNHFFVETLVHLRITTINAKAPLKLQNIAQCARTKGTEKSKE